MPTDTATPTYNRFAPLAERLAALDALDPAAQVFIPCGKCGGSGYIPGFGHVLNGVCFDCNGDRGTHRTVKRERTNVKAAIAREAKIARDAAAAEAARDAARDVWTTANPDVYRALMTYADDRGGLGAGSGFMESMLDTFTRRGALSDAQTTAVRNGLERRAAEAEAASPVLTGTVEITGDVLTTKEQFSDYGASWKMLVRDDRGFKVWGSIPAAIDDIEKGARVRFTATVEASRDDATFGYFKRPRKAEAL